LFLKAGALVSMKKFPMPPPIAATAHSLVIDPLWIPPIGALAVLPDYFIIAILFFSRRRVF